MRGAGFGTRPVTVGVVGRSGVGKTTLLECLIQALVARGLAVGAVKHTSHGFLADRPGKDSYRLYESGAEAVALASREQLATFVRRTEAGRHQPSLAAALETLPGDLDVVLAEGFSWESIPRIAVAEGSETLGRRELAAGSVIAVVQPSSRPCGSPPVFSQGVIEALACEVALRAGDAVERIALASVHPMPLRS